MTSADKTFTGSCHCQHIQYEIILTPDQLDNPEAGKCNCTWCQKRGVVGFRMSPSNFKLISPKEKTEMSSYEPKGPELHRWFCGTCGCHVYMEGQYEAFGKTHDAFTINLLTLDQPQEGLDLSKFKIGYVDGKHDNWMAGLRDTPWPEGCQ